MVPKWKFLSACNIQNNFFLSPWLLEQSVLAPVLVPALWWSQCQCWFQMYYLHFLNMYNSPIKTCWLFLEEHKFFISTHEDYKLTSKKCVTNSLVPAFVTINGIHWTWRQGQRTYLWCTKTFIWCCNSRSVHHFKLNHAPMNVDFCYVSYYFYTH